MSAKHFQEPSLGRLRRRARSLVHQHQSHDSSVADLLRASHPAFSGLSPDQIFSKPLHLSDAQLVIAREHGYQSWPQAKNQRDILVDQTQIASSEYRKQLASRKDLPPVGMSRVNRHGIEYSVVDHSFVMSLANVARANGADAIPNIDEFLPMISFPHMSPRLSNLYREVDCCTSKDLLFFDTMPDKFPGQAAPGVHMVCTTQDPRCLTFHFDASRLHETIIAHEFGHLWIEFVEGCEDWRNPRDFSDITKVVQFQHIQSFVLDLKVNDLIQQRGFDMSIINNDQLEAIREMARHCAKGDLPKTKRAAAGMANTIAAAILEQKRWPKAVLPNLQTCLAVIQAGQPEIYRLAEQFVDSVKRHGYTDRASICRVIDECATLSFEATGDDFDPIRDLVEEPPTEWMEDKCPDFLPGLPVPLKLEVWKTAARHGLGTDVQWELGITEPDRMDIRLQANTNSGRRTEPIILSFNVARDQIDTSRLRKIATLPWQIERQLPLPSQPVTDADSQPIHASNRNYMPGVGRWLSRAGFEEQRQGEHPYGYANNNPIRYIDPLGLCGFPHDCSNFPGGACAYAKSIGADHGDEGGIVCCNGSKQLCVWSGNIPPDWRPGVSQCVKEHEKTHLPQVDCPSAGFSRPGFKPGENPNNDECNAYSAEIACYLRKRDGECGKLTGSDKTKCESDYDIAIFYNACDITKSSYKCPSTPSACSRCKGFGGTI